jgi:predicted NodU family carbamoyl transferase
MNLLVQESGSFHTTPKPGQSLVVAHFKVRWYRDWSDPALSISAYYHDSAAALIRSGEIIAAAQEERFSRKKHDARFPVHAIRSCLEIGQVSLQALDYVVFSDKPLVKFDRLLETYLGFAPKGFRCASDANLAQRKIVSEKGAEKKTLYRFNHRY